MMLPFSFILSLLALVAATGTAAARAPALARITVLSGTGVGDNPLVVEMTAPGTPATTGTGTLPRGSTASATALSFVLELTREAFPAKSHAQDADGKPTPVSLDHHLFYAGHVVGRLESSSVRLRGVVHETKAALGAGSGGAPLLPAALFGTIHQGADVWVVEVVDGDDHDESTPPAMAIRHANDYDFAEADFGKCQHDPDDEGHTHADHAAANTSSPPPPSSRGRRAGPAAGHTQCNIFLDADQTYFDQWKGTCPRAWDSSKCSAKQVERVTIKMVDVLHQSDNIWSGDRVLKRIMKLVVAGTNVQVRRSGGGLPDMRVHGRQGSPKDQGDASALLNSYGYWWVAAWLNC